MSETSRAGRHPFMDDRERTDEILTAVGRVNRKIAAWGYGAEYAIVYGGWPARATLLTARGYPLSEFVDDEPAVACGVVLFELEYRLGWPKRQRRR